MNKQSLIVAGIGAVILVSVAVILLSIALIVFTYYSGSPKETSNTSPTPVDDFPDSEPTPTPVPTPTPLSITSSDVISMEFSTGYKGFFEKKSKCSKSYNELFGDKDGVFSTGSPCRAEISFNRNGEAVKSIKLSRYNKEKRSSQVIEESVWKAYISKRKFNEVADSIINSESFKNWHGGTITVANTELFVKYKGGSRQVLSNITEHSGRKPMRNEFTDVKLKWKKVK